MTKGSLADFLSLEEALQSYHTAEANAKAFDNTSVAQIFARQEQLRARQVTSAAAQCGHTLRDPLGPIEWATKMVGSFKQHIRRAA
jgi:hypothetical protein